MYKFFKIDNLINKLLFYSLLIVIFFLPINHKYSIICLNFSILFWIISKNWLYFKNFTFLSNSIILPAFLWIIYSVSLLYSDDLNRGLSDIQQKLSLILFPLIFISSFKYLYKETNTILLVFILGLFFTGVLCFLNAFYQSLSYVGSEIVFNPIPKDYYWENYFLYTRFAMSKHPTYLSMYNSLGIGILFSFLKRNRFPSYKIGLIVFTIVLLVVINFLLSSRAGVISTLIVVLFGLFWLFFKRLNIIWGTTILICIVVSFFLLAKKNDRFSYLMDYIGLTKVADNHTLSADELEQVVSGTNVRSKIWFEIPRIIEDNWFFGVGIGDTQDVLISNYKKSGILYAADAKLNVHNQYLEILVGIGVLGLLVFLFMLFVGIWKSFLHKDMLLFMFILIVSTNFLFESIFERVFGVMFFSFFYCLLMIKEQKVE